MALNFILIKVLPKIAIIHSDTLAAIGLKQIIQDVMPIVSVDVYHSIKELITSSSLNIYYHYFIAANVIDNNFHFFENKKRKTIILCSSPKAKSLFNGYHTLYTGYPEKELIKSILCLEQTAHAEGKNLPKIEIQDKQLSPREIEVITLIVKGYINKEIADRLNIGLTTVITHRRNIMNKLNLKSISALTIYAVTHGYVSINEIQLKQTTPLIPDHPAPY